MAEQNQQRQVAVKLRIADILNGQYIKEEGWTPNYVLLKNSEKASRVNLLGTIVSVPAVDMNYRSMMLDDGTGKISVRSFDEADIFKGVGLGDIVFLIGRPRQYGSETYVTPEIIKKVDNKAWIEVRKLEIEQSIGSVPVPQSPAEEPAEEAPEQLPAVEEVVEEPIAKAPEIPSLNETEPEIIEKPVVPEQQTQNPQQKIYSLIKELDNGEGAEFETIIEKSGCEDAEKIISRLLMEGEIFELGKGKLKVLE